MYNFLLYFDTKIYKALHDSSQSREKRGRDTLSGKKLSRHFLIRSRMMRRSGTKSLKGLQADQKSTRWEEKSGNGDDRLVLVGEGQGKMKPPTLTTLLSPPCRLGSIPTVSLAIADVYSTISSARITTEIMVDDNLRIRWWICRRRRRISNKREIELKWKFGGMTCEEERPLSVSLYRWKSFPSSLFVTCTLRTRSTTHLAVFSNLPIIIICVLFF